MSKHTPGPWRAWHDSYGRFQIMAGGLPLSPSRDGAQPGEGEANAALIAAAPDLLDALQALVAAFDADLHDLMIAKLAAKAAITQATGGAK